MNSLRHNPNMTVTLDVPESLLDIIRQRFGESADIGHALVTLALESQQLRPWLNAQEVAELLGIDSSGVRRLCIAGRVPGAVKTARGWEIPAASIEGLRSR